MKTREEIKRIENRFGLESTNIIGKVNEIIDRVNEIDKVSDEFAEKIAKEHIDIYKALTKLSQPEKKGEFRQVTKNLKNEIETTPLKEHIKEDEGRLKELLGKVGAKLMKADIDSLLADYYKKGKKLTKADINSILVDDYEREMNK